MGDTITRKDLEEILDKKLDQKLGQYQFAVIEAVDFKFQSLEQIMALRFQALEHRMDLLETKLDRLVTTLDNFLKRLTDHEDEFKILKAEVGQIKAIFKEKFNIEIAL